MAGDTVQQVKDRLSIVDVVSQYVKLERSGGSLRARCPFHAEKTPSFFVSPERGTYHCFGCGVGGDIFSFVQQAEGLDFKGALKVLAEKAGVPFVYERGIRQSAERDERDRLFELMETVAIFYTSRLDDASRVYLAQRGMSESIIKEFRLGLAGNDWSAASDHLKGKAFSEREIVDAGMARAGERGLIDKFRNRIMFPIADAAGRIVGFSGRIFGEYASPDAPKYLNSPETPLFHKSRILYGFDKAKLVMRKFNCAVLVEGQMDLLASHQAGWGNTVAVSGTAFTHEHAQLVRRMTDNLVIALDADEAGIKAAGRAARAALQGSLNVKVARLPSGMDPADLILKSGKDAWGAAIRDSRDIIAFLLDVLEERAKDRDAFRRTVEAAVLPFLADVASPIAREQYEHDIAKRLGVSEKAVASALAKVPTPMAQRPPDRSASQAVVVESADRVRNAYAILLWQRSKASADIDAVKCEQDLACAVGAEAFAALESLPEEEKERLRFSAEAQHGASTSLTKEVDILIAVIHRDRLASERNNVQAALQSAELAQDDAEEKRLMGVINMLTKEIAKLHEKG